MKSIRKTIAFVGFALLASNAAHANLVGNGSFETFTGAFGADGGAQLLSTSSTLTGWTIVGGEIAVLRNPNAYNLTPFDGNNFLDLTGYTNTGFPKGISQTITGLTIGDHYSFSLDLGIRNGACVSGGNNCHGPIQVNASIGGVSQTFTLQDLTTGNVWASFGFNFTAASTSTLLTINGISVPAGNEFIGLDNVAVNDVTTAAAPEPEVLWLLAVGAIAATMRIRRSRSHADR